VKIEAAIKVIEGFLLANTEQRFSLEELISGLNLKVKRRALKEKLDSYVRQENDLLRVKEWVEEKAMIPISTLQLVQWLQSEQSFRIAV
jgi:hypothetical protein